jgi:hypothetical protein
MMPRFPFIIDPIHILPQPEFKTPEEAKKFDDLVKRMIQKVKELNLTTWTENGKIYIGNKKL